MTRSENRERKYFFVIKNEGGVKKEKKAEAAYDKKISFFLKFSFDDGFGVFAIWQQD